MQPVELVFALGWSAFWIYWLVAAFSVKRGHVLWAHQLRVRVIIVVLVIVLTRFGAFRGHGLDTNPWRFVLGLVLFALGLGSALWARWHIGRNWGTPMSRKDDPELVTIGPYRIGTAVALDWLWLTAVAVASVFSVYSAIVEERNMDEQFPATYPAYRCSTKMLIPFIF